MQLWRDDDSDSFDGAFSGVRVLLVGDQEPFLERLAELFDGAGHRARMVFDARSAIASVGNAHADVVVCDLGATRLQSIATILALRTLGDDAPPVVVVSSMPNVAAHCQTLKVSHFLPQPFRFARLRELAERLGRRYQLAPNERSGVYLRQQTDEMLDALPDLDALSFG